MMGTRAPAVPADIDVPATVGEPDDAAPTAPIDEEADESHELDDRGPLDESGSAPTPTLPQKESARPAAAPAPAWASSLLRSLQSAPIRVRCFGACEAWYGGRLLKIARPELLLLLAVHPISGIQSELLADMLWNEPKEDPDTALRKPRFKLRRQLHRLVPEVTADPVPGSATKGEKVVALDKAVVSSDAHEFTEQELKDLVAFYKSTLGQKLLLSEPKAIQMSMGYMNQWAQAFADQVSGEFRAEMRKRGKQM